MPTHSLGGASIVLLCRL